ncbi:MAG: hypothetical protein EBY29_01090 [Planctomycetes bacterium]|nr:hypothetical protein [Planctomycetota bacterium]
MDVIEGVSIISIGEAKGHGLYVDEQTLMEVKTCAESYKGGVKVNLDHGAGIKDIVGFVNNFRIVGNQLLGDLNLLETSPMRDYVLEISSKLPDTFGISIAFSGPIREVDGMDFASCTELYSADLVQTPAANATGLFSFTAKQVDSFSKQMPEDTATTAMPEDSGESEVTIVDLSKRMSALEEAFGSMKTQMEAMIPAEKPVAEMKEEMTAELSVISKLEAKLDSIISNFGAAPVKASVVAEEKAVEKFDLKAVITQKTEELGSRTEAIRFAMRNHREAYIEARDNNELNF